MQKKNVLLVLEDRDEAFLALERQLLLVDADFETLRETSTGAVGKWARLRGYDNKVLLLDVFMPGVVGRNAAGVFINNFPVFKHPTLLWTAEIGNAVELLKRGGWTPIIVTEEPDLARPNSDVKVVDIKDINFKVPAKKGEIYICAKIETPEVVTKFLEDAFA